MMCLKLSISSGCTAIAIRNRTGLYLVLSPKRISEYIGKQNEGMVDVGGERNARVPAWWYFWDVFIADNHSDMLKISSR